MSANTVTLSGNLTRDPELRFTTKGTPQCQFGIAVKEKQGEKETVSFFDVECWGSTAEAVAESVRKGAPVIVSGKLRFNQWDDKATGKKMSRVNVTAYEVGALIFKRKDQQQAPAPRPVQNQSPQLPLGGKPAEDDPDDVPF